MANDFDRRFPGRPIPVSGVTGPNCDPMPDPTPTPAPTTTPTSTTTPTPPPTSGKLEALQGEWVGYMGSRSTMVGHFIYIDGDQMVLMSPVIGEEVTGTLYIDDSGEVRLNPTYVISTLQGVDLNFRVLEDGEIYMISWRFYKD